MKYIPRGEGYAEVAYGLWFPRNVLVYGDAPGLPPRLNMFYRFHCWLTLEVELLEYRATRLDIGIEDGRHGPVGGWKHQFPRIDPEALRAFRFSEMQAGIGGAVACGTDNLPEEAERASPFGHLRDVPDSSIDQDALRVAHVYVKEALSGRKGAKGVSEEFGVSIATAGRRIRHAKDLGYMWAVGRETIDLWNDLERQRVKSQKDDSSAS